MRIIPSGHLPRQLAAHGVPNFLEWSLLHAPRDVPVRLIRELPTTQVQSSLAERQTLETLTQMALQDAFFQLKDFIVSLAEELGVKTCCVYLDETPPCTFAGGRASIYHGFEFPVTVCVETDKWARIASVSVAVIAVFS